MAFEIPVLDFTLPSGEDLSTRQYHLVSVNASGEAVLAAAGAIAVGVLQNTPKQGEPAGIRSLGITKLVTGAALVAGQAVTCDASGQGVAAQAGDAINGVALAGTTVAGQIISLLLKGGQMA